MRSLVWFRSDLRTSDNRALHAAAARSTHGLVAVCTLTPNQWARHDISPAKISLLLRNLQTLSKDLAQLNIALKVLLTPTFADSPQALLSLAQSLDCTALWFNQEHELNEKIRDHETTELFHSQGLAAHALPDQTLFEPGAIRTQSGHYYSVFSPFAKAWLKELEEDPDRAAPLPPPQSQPEMVSTPDPIPPHDSLFPPSTIPADLWPAGQARAAAALDAFIESALTTYSQLRDIPSLNATSTLSPHLNLGVLSPRQILARVSEAHPDPLNELSPAWPWLRQIIFREFYRHILVGFPRVCTRRAFKPETDRITWNDNPEHLAAWQQGRTGFPIVDAAMRQLNQTGWMHNRLRMIAAMFLTKDLFLDWRLGERYFSNTLVDADLACNNAGWQWAASTGTDAAPYFRIFNPATQSKKADPQGRFIRRYVPELAHLPDTHLHQPASLPPLERSALEYPEPLVDHAEARLHAIEQFKAIR